MIVLTYRLDRGVMGDILGADRMKVSAPQTLFDFFAKRVRSAAEGALAPRRAPHV